MQKPESRCSQTGEGLSIIETIVNLCGLRKHCLLDIASSSLSKKHHYLLTNIKNPKTQSITMLFQIPPSFKDHSKYHLVEKVCVAEQAITLGKPHVIANLQGISPSNIQQWHIALQKRKYITLINAAQWTHHIEQTLLAFYKQRCENKYLISVRSFLYNCRLWKLDCDYCKAEIVSALHSYAWKFFSGQAISPVHHLQR